MFHSHAVTLQPYLQRGQQGEHRREKVAHAALQLQGTQIEGVIQLVSITGGKTKRYTLSKTVTTIGRASSNVVSVCRDYTVHHGCQFFYLAGLFVFAGNAKALRCRCRKFFLNNKHVILPISNSCQTRRLAATTQKSR